MFGPALTATSGISNVINNWICTGIHQHVELRYIATLDEYVPGQHFVKLCNGLRSYLEYVVTRSSSYDLVHIHLSSAMSFYRKLVIFVIAKLKKDKVLVHLHGSEFEEFYNSGGSIQKRMVTWMFDQADVVLVLSNKWQKFAKSISSNENISVLYNGAIPEQFLPSLHDQNNINILFMGRLGARKGTFDLLEAFLQIHEGMPNAKLILGGDGEVEKAKQFVAENSLQSKVEIKGWLTGQDKIDAFRSAHIYVLPSYNEGLPGSVLEAMAAGLPVISTSVGGIPEAVLDDVNGIIINPGDIEGLRNALLKLCNDGSLRKKMGKESLALANNKFYMKNIVADLLKIYKQHVT